MSLLADEKSKRIYSRKDVFDELRGVVNVTEREISYWTDLEIVLPDIANPRSQGKTRFYSLLNVIDVAVVKRLLEAGFKLEFIKKVMDFLRSGRETREFFYNGNTTARLLVFEQNTDRMRVAIENKKLPEAVVVGSVDSIKKAQSAFEKMPLTVSEPFETFFSFNVTPLVRKIIGNE